MDGKRLYGDKPDRPSGFHPVTGDPKESAVEAGEPPKLFRFEYPEQHLKRAATAFAESLQAKEHKESKDATTVPSEAQHPNPSSEQLS